MPSPFLLVGYAGVTRRKRLATIAQNARSRGVVLRLLGDVIKVQETKREEARGKAVAPGRAAAAERRQEAVVAGSRPLPFDRKQSLQDISNVEAQFVAWAVI
jgi:hypothetical protein